MGCGPPKWLLSEVGVKASLGKRETVVDEEETLLPLLSQMGFSDCCLGAGSAAGVNDGAHFFNKRD